MTLHACEENAAGATAQEYTGATCATKGVGKYRTIPVAAGTPTTPTTVGTQAIAGTILGVKVLIECKGMTGTGEGENVTLGGVKFAFVKALTINYSECTVAEPKGEECAVPGEAIKSTQLRLKSYLEKETIRTELFREGGELIAIVALEGCKDFELNEEWWLKGTIRGFTGADPSLIEFAGGGTEVVLAGNPATYTGNMRLFMEGTTKRLAFATP